MLTVEKVDETTFTVTVQGTSTTRHTVTVSPAYVEEMTGGRRSAEELIKQSFEFLLEREGNTSILSRFDLPVIGRYFPEYEDTIRKRLV